MPPAILNGRALAASRVPALAASALATALLFATGCATSHSGGASAPADPLTIAQANARLLQHGKTPGFLAYQANLPNRPVRAKPFVPPQGSTGHLCTYLTSPALFRPTGSLNVGESISLAMPLQQRYQPLPPTWFEWISVFPGTEAADTVKALPALIDRCAQFTYQAPTVTAKIAAHEAVAPLRGLGDQALYVTVRLLSKVPGRFVADDWIVIRSDRTLIWIDGQNVQPPATGRDQSTLHLARDAWHRYLAA